MTEYRVDADSLGELEHSSNQAVWRAAEDLAAAAEAVADRSDLPRSSNCNALYQRAAKMRAQASAAHAAADAITSAAASFETLALVIEQSLRTLEIPEADRLGSTPRRAAAKPSAKAKKSKRSRTR